MVSVRQQSPRLRQRTHHDKGRSIRAGWCSPAPQRIEPGRRGGYIGLRGRGITLDWQVNRIRGETVAEAFTGGIYVDGVTHLDVAAVEGGYRIRGSPVELGGALSRLDADGFAQPWDQATLALNFYAWSRFFGKLQISHSWTSSRRGVPGADFQETRVQVEYGW